MITIGAIRLVDVRSGKPVGETRYNTIIVRLKKCRIFEVRAVANIEFDQQEVTDDQTVEFYVSSPAINIIGLRPVPTVPSSVMIIPSRDADPLPNGRFEFPWNSIVRIDTADYGYGTYQMNLTVRKGNQLVDSSRKTVNLELSPILELSP